MKSFVIFFFALVATAMSIPLSAEQYPANISPALCPDYPNCDNSLLHGTAPVVSFVPEMPVNVPTVYPAGVHPSACPNYPFCNSVAQIVMPLEGFSERLYPPGVHPSACPYYPQC